MPPTKSIRDMAATNAALKDRPEPIPERPEALADEPRDGMQRGREVAARYGENLALYAAAIAFGEGTKSLHTRLAGDAAAVEHGAGSSRDSSRFAEWSGADDQQLSRPAMTSLASDRVELLGSDGTMIVDDDHMEHLLFSEKGIPHPYVAGHAVEMAFLGSNSAGDWALGDFWGPLGHETRAWLDFLSTGRQSVHATPEQALLNLKVTYAIERAAATGQVVRLD